VVGDKTDRAEATRYDQLANSVSAWPRATARGRLKFVQPPGVVFSLAETESNEGA